MVFLAFVWVGLLVVEYAGGDFAWLQPLADVIWVLFFVDFALRLFLAPKKAAYIRRNWLTLVSLALPALRIFRLLRVLRLARASRALRIVRLAGSVNRGVRALVKSMGRKGVGYVLALTVVVSFTGAAAVYAFEPGAFRNYWDALWWTAMMMTTMGSEFWPQSLEGRLLSLLLALYAFSIFGYVTAALASILVQREQPPQAASESDVRDELALLRAELSQLTDALAAARSDTSFRRTRPRGVHSPESMKVDKVDPGLRRGDE